MPVMDDPIICGGNNTQYSNGYKAGKIPQHVCISL
jgi:hypothetical protein